MVDCTEVTDVCSVFGACVVVVVVVVVVVGAGGDMTLGSEGGWGSCFLTIPGNTENV